MAWSYDNGANIINHSRVNSYLPSCQGSREPSSSVVSRPVWFGQLARSNGGMCHLVASQSLPSSLGKTRDSFTSLWCHILAMLLFQKGACHILLSLPCAWTSSKGRLKEMELPGGHMTVVNSGPQVLSSAFPHRILPEPWRPGSENEPGLWRKAL